MTGFLDHLLNLRGTIIYLVVGLLVFAEDALFVGFVIPGETAAILGGNVTVGGSGYSEFAEYITTGKMRAIGVTSDVRIKGLDVPTLKEKGIDLEFANWRGVVAPPGLSEEDKQVWIDAFTKMHESAAWKAQLEEKGWVDAFATGDEFGTFLKEQDTKVADLLQTLGLA